MRRSIIPALGLSAALVLTGCGSSSPGGSSNSPSPTPSSTPSATITPSPSHSASPTPTQSASVGHRAPLTIYYIAVGDGGKAGPAIGCGDSAVATLTAPVTYVAPVGQSMRALLANHSRMLGQSGLVNALYQSRLTYLRATIQSGTVTVFLSGRFQLGGTCDIPRVKAQLQYTAMKAAGVPRARIYIDGRSIDQALSLK